MVTPVKGSDIQKKVFVWRKEMKKRILIYGDSNTWGYRGKSLGRYDTKRQWTNIFQQMLGDEYEVIQQGLRGRTAGNCHKQHNLYKDGKTGYEISLQSNSPVDYVIIALGTNDANPKYERIISEVAQDLNWYETYTKEYAQRDAAMKNFKKVLFLGVSNFQDNDYFKPAVNYSTKLNKALQKSCENVIIPPDLIYAEDKLHFNEADHKKVAEKVYEEFKEREA